MAEYAVANCSRTADTGGEGLGGHRIGDADKEIGLLCGGFFDGDIEFVY